MTTPAFQAPAPPTAEPAGGGTAASPTPPWGEDFDPARAWQTIQNLREVEKEAVQLRKQVKTSDDETKLAEYDRLVQASKSDLDRKSEEAARWQTEAERWRAASLSSRIEVLAGQDFADPSDAAAALSDPSKYLDAGGVINEAAIQADLAALLDKKPHWRRQENSPGPRLPVPNAAQGAGGQAVANPAAAFAAILQGQMNGSR